MTHPALRPGGLLLVFLAFLLPGIPGVEAPSPGVVVWKFDDLRTGPRGNVSAIKPVVAWSRSTGTPISLGVIADRLHEATSDEIQWLQVSAAERGGTVEFWLHGWDHRKVTDAQGTTIGFEFKGTGLTSQTASLRQSQEAMQQIAGLTCTTFGAPYNASDADTPQALDTLPEVTVWLFGPPGDTRRQVLPASLRLETKTGVVSSAAFFAAYDRGPRPRLLVLQGHSPYWNQASFTEFVRIADRLRSDGWVSRLPRACRDLGERLMP